MTTVGEVEMEDVLIKKIEWRIDDFFALPVDDDDTLFKSPVILFESECWNLGVFPNGITYNDSVGHIGLYLYRIGRGPPIHLSGSFSFKTLDGERDEERFANLEESFLLWGCHKFMARSTLLERRAQLVPSDTLTIVCTIMHDSKTPKNTANEKLIDDMRNIFNSDEYSDVIIKVKDEEFRLHRNILAGRSPYFRSLFQSKENTTPGIVTIDDCEVDIFRKYARFIYTGKVDEMTEKNVCDLFKVADKYKEEQMKVECLCFMMRKMSVENFCDFTALALKHDEKDLLECATVLFCEHSKEIITSVKWETLLRDYPKQANELYIKAHGDK